MPPAWTGRQSGARVRGGGRSRIPVLLDIATSRASHRIGARQIDTGGVLVAGRRLGTHPASTRSCVANVISPPTLAGIGLAVRPALRPVDKPGWLAVSPTTTSSARDASPLSALRGAPCSPLAPPRVVRAAVPMRTGTGLMKVNGSPIELLRPEGLRLKVFLSSAQFMTISSLTS